MKGCKVVLEDECSAFRFGGGELTRVTDDEQKQIVEKALTAAAALKLEAVETHLRFRFARA
jgi:hypothetical protein